jgi:CheY-like chemotaxis protein
MMDRALIADNDKFTHYAISRVLQRYFAEIKAVSTGDEALREISDGLYRLCFLDASLIGVKGTGLIKTIHTLSPKTKVVVMADPPFDDEATKDMEECCFCLLRKPFEVTQVRAIAERALGRTGDEPPCGSRGSDNTLPVTTVHYSITILDLGKPAVLNLQGDATHIDDSGIGMRTHYPLEPGQLIVFTSGLDHTHHTTGIVKRSGAAEDGKTYRAEVDFIDS